MRLSHKSILEKHHQLKFWVFFLHRTFPLWRG